MVQVYLRNRSLMPVPADIATHPDFRAVFGEGAAIFCVVAANNVNRRKLTVMHQRRVYDISAWRPLTRADEVQNLAAALQLTQLEKGRPEGKDSKSVRRPQPPGFASRSIGPDTANRANGRAQFRNTGPKKWLAGIVLCRIFTEPLRGNAGPGDTDRGSYGEQRESSWHGGSSPL